MGSLDGAACARSSWRLRRGRVRPTSPCPDTPRSPAVGGDLGRQAFGDLGAVIHDDDAVGQLHDQVELVLDQQDGEPGP